MDDKRSTIELWTDGACSGNPGPGGWAAILRRRVRLPVPTETLTGSAILDHYRMAIADLEARGLVVAEGRSEQLLAQSAERLMHEPNLVVRVPVDRELSGGVAQTTNNRMEISGLLFGLRGLERPAQVVVHTDSNYLMKAFTEHWLDGWQRRGWKTAAGKPVANQDLWRDLVTAMEGHKVSFVKVSGHAGVSLNERVDRLAVAARIDIVAN